MYNFNPYNITVTAGKYDSFDDGYDAYEDWVLTQVTGQCEHCGAYLNQYGVARDHWNPLVRAPWDRGNAMPHFAYFFGIKPEQKELLYDD